MLSPAKASFRFSVVVGIGAPVLEGRGRCTTDPGPAALTALRSALLPAR
jgi:hypothetical protein